MQKKHTNSFWFSGLLLIVLCLALFLLNVLLPARSWSSVENRPLKTASSLDWKEIGTDEFAKEAEEVSSDQMIGRPMFLHLNYLVRKAFGQNELNGVWLGKKRLFLQSDVQNADLALQTVSDINTWLRNKNVSGLLMVVPCAGEILTKDLPSFVSYDQKSLILDSIYQNCANVRGVDIRSDLASASDPQSLYYRTDHHWTSMGAMIGAQNLVNAAGMSFDPSAFELLQISDSFEGTLADKTGSVGLKDDIYIASNQSEPEYIVNWADGSRSTSIFDDKALEQKDQYQLFLGVNQGIIHIDINQDSDRHLLIFKDSYANSMIQYLIPYYGTITILDPRYFKGDLEQIYAQYTITECAFIYSTETFASNKSLSSLLESDLPEQEENTDENADDQSA